MAVARYGDRPCIDFLDKIYSYDEIGELVRRAAKGFQTLGVGKGSRIGLCLPNTPYYVICYYAILKAGGTVVNFNPLYAKRELKHQVSDSGTTIMVTLNVRQIYPKVADLLQHTCLKKIVVCSMSEILPPFRGLLFSIFKRSQLASIPEDDHHVSFETLTINKGAPTPVTIDAHEDIALLQYTGGTTGTPKGAMLTHANLTSNVDQLIRWYPEIDMGNEVMLAVIPFFHVFSMTVAMNVGLAVGAEIIMLPRFELDQVLDTITKKHPTLFPGVPTIFAAIGAAENLDRHDLSSLRVCLSGGAALPLAVRQKFETLTGCYLVEGYGLSEASPVTACNPIGGVNKEGSIGLPLPGTLVEIRDPDNPERLMPPGEIGEICFTGPQIMAGYWNNAEETKQTLRGTRLHTGDIGYLDDDGYIFLVDRIKDLILCSGFNVYPRNIEDAIYLHPAVEEVTVIGVSDEYRGQTPKAFIKLKEGQPLTTDELRMFLQDKLSKIEMPEFIEFRDELPKTMIGKLSKKELVAQELTNTKNETNTIAPNKPH
ncbi:MAG: long-chain fatty acid--CoA ligase [Rhodospirillales bacterium]|nr:long-chain fatty acid--CoA ligase [Rhodospirillales bacterium]